MKNYCISSELLQFNETLEWFQRFYVGLIRLSLVTIAWAIIFILAACSISAIGPQVIIPMFSDSEYLSLYIMREIDA